jgi:dihydrodipicolinate synthase/N-acetylneuraminate lyase
MEDLVSSPAHRESMTPSSREGEHARFSEVSPRGVIAPIASPITRDGRVNEPVLRNMLQRLVPEVDGVLVLGTSGEMPALLESTAFDIARCTIDEIAGRTRVFIGVGDTSLPRTLARIDRFGPLGADLLAITAPYYFAMTDAGLIDYFTSVADASPIPIVLYNIPQATHNPLSLEVIQELAAHPRIMGIKDSQGDPFLFADLINLRSDGFTVLQGREQLLAQSIWAGADGSVTSLTNIAPRLVRALSVASADPAGREDARQLQIETTRLGVLFSQGHWVSALKAALRMLGWEVGEPQAPLEPLTDHQLRAVAAILDGTEPQRLLRAENNSPSTEVAPVG